jgi:hypothetical protein
MATDCEILSPLSPNCGVPLELPVAVRSKPIAPLARYIARVSPARGRGLAHEIKYDGLRSAQGSGYLAYGLIARKPGAASHREGGARPAQQFQDDRGDAPWRQRARRIAAGSMVHGKRPQNGLFAEVWQGAQVGEASFMLMTADTSIAAEHDEAVLRERLESYWAKHTIAARPPWFVDGKWPSSEGNEASTTDG